VEPEGSQRTGATSSSPPVPPTGSSFNRSHVYVRDRQAGRTERVSVGRFGTEADADSHAGAISPGGRFVVFTSSATNLVPGGTNGQTNLFLRDRRTGRTELVSVGRAGTGGNDEPDYRSHASAVMIW
jgi:hypothetical protein